MLENSCHYDKIVPFFHGRIHLACVVVPSPPVSMEDTFLLLLQIHETTDSSEHCHTHVMFAKQC